MKNSSKSLLNRKVNQRNPLLSLLFIEAQSKESLTNLSQKEISKLPKKLIIAYSIQFKTLAYNITKQLKSHKIQVIKTQQVLGCSELKTKNPILLIGQGKFHAQNLYLQTPLLYILEHNKINKISEQDIKSFQIKRKTALLKFLQAEKIGILVSTKPGQENLKQAIILREQLKKQGKTPYIFISNNIDITQFENFQIESWVNTACPGLAYDDARIININEF